MEVPALPAGAMAPPVAAAAAADLAAACLRAHRAHPSAGSARQISLATSQDAI